MLVVATVATQRATAQIDKNDKAAINAMMQKDSMAIKALALYPAETRKAILEAAVYPDALLKLQTMQERTRQDFQSLIGLYPRDEQEAIWNFTRYPGLVDRLVNNGKKTKSQLKTIAKDYPEEVTEDIVKYGRHDYDALTKVQYLTVQNQRDFDKLLNDVPPVTQQAFRDLVALPEVLSILTEHMQMTVLIGDLYMRNSAWVLHKADSLNLVVARQNAKETEDWKNNINNDAQAKAQLEQAANAYASENGYHEHQYRHHHHHDYIEHYRVYCYPYWFGYPWWYPYHYWYPYPYWYDWGFYYGPYGEVVVFGYPSFYFNYWYFYHPVHFYQYPVFTNVVINQYYGHRGSTSAGNAPVQNWISENRQYFKDDFETNSVGRVEQLKEFGQLQQQVMQHNATNPSDKITPREVIQKNPERYPNLNTKENQNKTIEPQEQNPWFNEQPAKVPPVNVPTQPRDERNLPKQDKTQPQPDIKQIPRERDRNAEDYHQRNWNRNEPPIFKQPEPQRPKIETKPKPDVKPKVEPKRPAEMKPRN